MQSGWDKEIEGIKYFRHSLKWTNVFDINWYYFLNKWLLILLYIRRMYIHVLWANFKYSTDERLQHP